ncbi:MAG: hypothetical protein JWL85_368 [Candidatus Saccharibacteria bacterium]|nr:hypothetical protein [Candidatus Saccharibacteria bacterium]
MIASSILPLYGLFRRRYDPDDWRWLEDPYTKKDLLRRWTNG